MPPVSHALAKVNAGNIFLGSNWSLDS